MSSIVLWYYSYIQKNYLQVEIAKTAEPNHTPPPNYLFNLLAYSSFLYTLWNMLSLPRKVSKLKKCSR